MDVFAIEADIGNDDAGAEMGFIAEDGIADVIEVGDFAIVEDDAVFELAGVSECGIGADNDVFTDVGTCAHGGAGADPSGTFDGGAGFDDGARCEIDVFS